VPAPQHHSRADTGQGPVLRAHDHRADDEDGRVGEHGQSSKDSGDGEEHQVGGRHRRLLTGASRQVLPDQGVTAVARCGALGLLGGPGQRQVHVLDGDGAVLGDTHLAQPAQDRVGAFPGDVDQDEVTLGTPGCAGQDDDVAAHLDRRCTHVRAGQDRAVNGSESSPPVRMLPWTA